ncbi:hypothetical protein QJS10_CPB11g00516 [Acorus calamus]|uniref:Superoxide dismutase copper chaperone n=1 Tax=Acorus calamus TaxID=4465 RepID=A0AAV9DVD9_ACOCL|nr:hypothetical protein QJS10_CPB11g00516 [Acorus calamus]
MSFLKTSNTTSSALPAAFAVAAVSTSSIYYYNKKTNHRKSNFSFPLKQPQRRFRLSSEFHPRQRSLVPLRSALHMDTALSSHQQSSERGGVPLPEMLTEFMVDMKCEGCVSAVKNKLQTVDGVKGVDVDLSNQVVRVVGSSSLKTMMDALEQTGRRARLIGQGSPEDFLVSAGVAEFKGPIIFGVVRLVQVNMELARIEANFSGLSPGKHGWSINEFGDLTKGAASTGKIFNSKDQVDTEEPLGDLGTLETDETGEAHFTGAKQMLRVPDLIGRAVVVYASEDKSETGITAAVIARSAGVGENYKKICTCDGTVIWESTNSDFVAA